MSTAISTARRVNVPVIFTKITPSLSGFEPVTVRIDPWRGGFRPEDMELIVQPQPNDIVLIRIPSPSLSAPTSSCPLRNSGRYTVVFTGIATDISIETSARHALVVGVFVLI